MCVTQDPFDSSSITQGTMSSAEQGEAEQTPGQSAGGLTLSLCPVFGPSCKELDPAVLGRK